nr:uncharacterized protein LOC124807809 isoform X2 [Hydra vulgaris]
MPESIVFLFANASNVSRIKAEVALSAYISERDKKRFCSSPEAYCRTGKTGIQSIFTFHLLERMRCGGFNQNVLKLNQIGCRFAHELSSSICVLNRLVLKS